MAVYQSGNTVTLTCKVRDIERNLVQPDSIKIIFYDRNWKMMNEVVIGEDNMASIGEYFYDYQTNPDEEEYINYEWNAVYKGRRTIVRKDFRTKRK